MNELLETDRNHVWHPFSALQQTTDLPLITKGSGPYLYTAQGNRIIDAISSWWVNLHGHAHPDIANAIATQAQQLEHVIFAGFTHEPAIRLTENLLTILPENYQRVFFSDNGSTAVEVALKMAIQYWSNRGVKKQKIIALHGAYHGDTFGAMAVGERGLFTRPFFPYLFDVVFVDFPSDEGRVLAQMETELRSGEVAAFIFEPLVQAAAGMRMYSPSVLDKMVALAHSADALCIADEVFTGFGRTGTYFAVDQLTNKPDIIALSKGITGGFLPLGVTACHEEVADAFSSNEVSKTFFHGHSYTANPLACAAANASFNLLAGDECQSRIRMISSMHSEFAESILHHSSVAEIRTQGTLLAIELRTQEETSYTNRLREIIYPWFMKRGVLMRPLGNVIYLVPPYCTGKDDLQYIYDSIREFLYALEDNTLEANL